MGGEDWSTTAIIRDIVNIIDSRQKMTLAQQHTRRKGSKLLFVPAQIVAGIFEGLRPHNMRPLQELAKAELHYHLEGGMRHTTVIELCNKYNLPVPPDTRNQRYTNFDNFAMAYMTACNCLREPEDIHRIVHEMLLDALDAGCIWMEVAPSLLLYCHRFGGVEDTILLLLQAASAAEDAVQGKAACAYIISAERMNPTSEAENLATITSQLVMSGQHIIHGLLDLVYMDLKLDTLLNYLSIHSILLPIVLILEMLDFLPP